MLDTSVTVHAHFKDPGYAAANATAIKAAQDSIQQVVQNVIARLEVENTSVSSNIAIMRDILWGGLVVGIKIMVNGKDHITKINVPMNIQTRPQFAEFLRKEFTQFVADTLLENVVLLDSNRDLAELNHYFKNY